MMQIYFLFGGDHYYPSGGLMDLVDSVEAESVGDARRQFEDRGSFDGIEWWQLGGFDGYLRFYESGNVNKELLYD